MIHPIPLAIDFIYFHSYTHLYKLLNNNILDFTINFLINVNNNVKHSNFHDALYSLFFIYGLSYMDEFFSHNVYISMNLIIISLHNK